MVYPNQRSHLENPHEKGFPNSNLIGKTLNVTGGITPFGNSLTVDL